jgi:hypothetical protein
MKTQETRISLQLPEDMASTKGSSQTINPKVLDELDIKRSQLRADMIEAALAQSERLGSLEDETRKY